MDFPSRDLYRRAIEQLARGSNRTELEIAQQRWRLPAGSRMRAPRCRQGAAGRELDRVITDTPPDDALAHSRYRASVWNRSSRFNTATGVGAISCHRLITAVVLSVPLLLLHAGNRRCASLCWRCSLIPSIDAAVALVNRAA